MPEHFSTSTKGILKYCSTCRKMTMHRVDFKRVGSCTEHMASGLSRKQELERKRLKEAEQSPTLF